ncbi:MAG: DNA polymerase III subunit delta [Pyrinomonadaceae bacterium]
MPLKTRENLRAQLKTKEFAPVYLLFGAETYLRDLAAKTIADFVLENASIREFNENEIDLNSHSVADVFAVASQIPMIDPMRVIRAFNVVVSAKKGAENVVDDDETVIRKYLESPPESTVLIFVADEIDKRRRIAKLLLEKTFAVEFSLLSGNDLFRWLKERARINEIEVSDGALNYLIARVGDDTRMLANELEKLATAASGAGEISTGLINELTNGTRELDSFEIANRLISDDREAALESCRKTLDDGAEPLMLLGSLAFNFRKLIIVKSLMEQGADSARVFSATGVPRRKSEQIITAARRGELWKFEQVVLKLMEADLRIKSSSLPPKLIFEMLICDIVAGK